MTKTFLLIYFKTTLYAIRMTVIIYMYFQPLLSNADDLAQKLFINFSYKKIPLSIKKVDLIFVPQNAQNYFFIVFRLETSLT